jgi:hypothetical protein
VHQLSPKNPCYNNNDYYDHKNNDEDSRVYAGAEDIPDQFAACHAHKQQKKIK